MIIYFQVDFKKLIGLGRKYSWSKPHICPSCKNRGIGEIVTGEDYLSGYGVKGTTAPFMNIDHGFDVVELASAAGATFVARTTTYHAKQMVDILASAIAHKGFSVVEIMTQCPTYFGRKNKRWAERSR